MFWICYQADGHCAWLPEFHDFRKQYFFTLYILNVMFLVNTQRDTLRSYEYLSCKRPANVSLSKPLLLTQEWCRPAFLLTSFREQRSMIKYAMFPSSFFTANDSVNFCSDAHIFFSHISLSAGSKSSLLFVLSLLENSFPFSHSFPLSQLWV